MANVKNPYINQKGPRGSKSINLPLILDRMVALATLVYSRAALRAQFAMNHTKQNQAASLAVSRLVSGGKTSS